MKQWTLPRQALCSAWHAIRSGKVGFPVGPPRGESYLRSALAFQNRVVVQGSSHLSPRPTYISLYSWTLYISLTFKFLNLLRWTEYYSIRFCLNSKIYVYYKIVLSKRMSVINKNNHLGLKISCKVIIFYYYS